MTTPEGNMNPRFSEVDIEPDEDLNTKLKYIVSSQAYPHGWCSQSMRSVIMSSILFTHFPLLLYFLVKQFGSFLCTLHLSDDSRPPHVLVFLTFVAFPMANFCFKSTPQWFIRIICRQGGRRAPMPGSRLSSA